MYNLIRIQSRIWPQARNIQLRSLSTQPTDYSNSQHFDIVIAGGGLVGTTLACAISKNKTLSEKTVLLLEGGPPFKNFTGGQYGNRVSAINKGSINLFKSIGAWEGISGARIKLVKQMRVWDGSSDALITFNHNNFDDDVACIIENDLILDAVYQELINAPNVQVRNMSKIEHVKLPSDGVFKSEVRLKEGDTFTCDLLFASKRTKI